MLGIHELWLFVLSGLLLNVTPGPDTAYIIGRTIQLGWRGGAAAAIGISCGCLVHVLGAAIGLSALLMASSTAFLAVKLIGAAYLVLTGLQMLLSRTKPIAEVAGQAGETSISRVFWQGALTNILNPKVALFFLAFLPQFVAADSAIRRSPSWCSADLHHRRHALVPRPRAFRRRPPAASGNRRARSAGSTARSARCSSISASASPCWRRASGRQSVFERGGLPVRVKKTRQTRI